MAFERQLDVNRNGCAGTLSDEERMRLMESLESKMGYGFKDRSLLEAAVLPSGEEDCSGTAEAGAYAIMESLMADLRSRGSSGDGLLEEMCTYCGMENIGRASTRTILSAYADAMGIPVSDADVSIASCNPSMLEAVAGAVLEDGGRRAYGRWYDGFCRSALVNAADVPDEMWLMMECYPGHAESHEEQERKGALGRLIDRTRSKATPIGIALKGNAERFLKGEVSIPYPVVSIATKKLPAKYRAPVAMAAIAIPAALFAASRIPDLRRILSHRTPF